MSNIDVELALDVGARHPEGPSWDAASGHLWWVDIVGERVHRFDPVSGRDDAWPTPGQPGGVIIRADGTPVIQAPDGLRALSTRADSMGTDSMGTGSTSLVTPIEADRPETRGNDLKVDGHGRVWAGTMPFDKRPKYAALYRVEHDTAQAVVTGLSISNGPAIDEANGKMYLADTALGIVDVFDFDVERGTIDRRRRFVDVSAEGWWPDGMTVDAEGGLWVALGRASRVRRYVDAHATNDDKRRDRTSDDGTSDDGDSHHVARGSLDLEVLLPTSHPTSVSFGGADGADLFITTSWFDVPEAQRPNEPHAGAIFMCHPGMAGPPAPRWPG